MEKNSVKISKRKDSWRRGKRIDIYGKKEKKKRI